MKKDPAIAFRLCIKSEAFPGALEVRKVYQVIPDAVAAARGWVRIVDETGKDYLCPEDSFVPVDLPPAAVSLFMYENEWAWA